jgi:hypothetical protein
MLSHFTKLLSHSRYSINHSLEWLTWVQGAGHEHGSIEDAQLGWGESQFGQLGAWDWATQGHAGRAVRRMPRSVGWTVGSRWWTPRPNDPTTDRARQLRAPAPRTRATSHHPSHVPLRSSAQSFCKMTERPHTLQQREMVEHYSKQGMDEHYSSGKWLSTIAPRMHEHCSCEKCWAL